MNTLIWIGTKTDNLIFYSIYSQFLSINVIFIFVHV